MNEEQTSLVMGEEFYCIALVENERRIRQAARGLECYLSARGIGSADDIKETAS